MKSNALPINWFDCFLLIWLTMGILRGRKRGLSQELLTFLQWVVIVGFGAVAYQPIGDWLSQTISGIGLLTAYIVGYLVAAGLVALAFVLFKRMFQGKLIGSDVFGKGEYYLGMPAGMLRFLCMSLAGLALLNARLYTPQEIQAYKKYQMENFDSEFFSGLQAYQSDVLEKSFSGHLIKEHLSFLLIRPTAKRNSVPFKQKDWKGP